MTCAEVWRRLNDEDKKNARKSWYEHIKNDPQLTASPKVSIPKAISFFSEKIEKQIKNFVEKNRNRITYVVHLVKQKHMEFPLLDLKTVWGIIPSISYKVGDFANDAAVEYFACLIKFHENDSIELVQLALEAENFLSDICYPASEEVFYTYVFDTTVVPHLSYITDTVFATQATVKDAVVDSASGHLHWEIETNTNQVVCRRYSHVVYMVEYLSDSKMYKERMKNCPSVPTPTANFEKSLLQDVLNYLLSDTELRKSLAVCRFFYDRIPFYTTEIEIL
jgi:hypothetical protein